MAGYCRYSSNNQREESIEAQRRAIEERCREKGWVIFGWYIDRALSGTSDDRPDFLRMVDDSKDDLFDIVLVHKLDRFSRDTFDKELYKRKLENNGAILQSVLEELTDTPEGALLEGVISAMNAFYSKNLAREVLKGLKENALKGEFTGGRCLFGYTIDPATKKYIINESEAEGVRLMFRMVQEGNSYAKIAEELNHCGHRTKRGRPFGTNSLHDMLTNEKYIGQSIYNKYASTKKNGKTARRPHQLKSEAEWIVADGAIPAIISKEDFQRVQDTLKSRKNKMAAAKAKQVYLLSGKIVCGECGSAFSGNRRPPKKGSDKPYISYRCNRFNKTVECHNTEVNRELLEAKVLRMLSDIIYDERKIPVIAEAYQNFQREQGGHAENSMERIQTEISKLDKKLANTVEAIAASGGSAVLLEMLTKLETEKRKLTADYERIKADSEKFFIDEDTLRQAFYAAKQTFKNGELNSIKVIVQRFVDKVTVYPDGVQISLNLDNQQLKSILQEQEEKNAASNVSVTGGVRPLNEGTVYCVDKKDAEL